MPVFTIKESKWEYTDANVVVTATGGTYTSETKVLKLTGMKITGLADTAALKNIEGKITKCQVAPLPTVKGQSMPSVSLVGKKAKCTAHTARAANADFTVS